MNGRRAVLADVVDRDDVRVGRRAARRPAPRAGSARGRASSRQRAGEHLHGHEAVEHVVVGRPDGAPSRRWPRGARRGSAGKAGGVGLEQARRCHPHCGWAYPPERRANSRAVLLYSPAHGQGLSQLRQGSRLRQQPQPLDGRHQAALRPEPAEVRIVVGGAPRRVYVCTRCLKAGKVTKAAMSSRPELARSRPARRVRSQPRPLSRRRRRRARAARVAPPGGQRPERLPGRRRRHGRQHGADAAAPCSTELDRLAAGDGRPIDEIGRDEIVDSVARAALLGARGNSGVILSPAHPRRGRGADLAAPASSSTRC